MTEKDFREAKLQCYALAHSLGQNGKQQNELIDALRDCELNDSNELVICHMLAVFYNGLMFGNWPWSPKTVDGILTEQSK